MRYSLSSDDHRRLAVLGNTLLNHTSCSFERLSYLKDKVSPHGRDGSLLPLVNYVVQTPTISLMTVVMLSYHWEQFPKS